MHKPQMKRMTAINIAQSLESAADSALDSFLELGIAYTMAKRAFTADENDPDPTTIALGVQAQALGCRTLALWLIAIAEVTERRYIEEGKTLLDRIEREMDALGLVLPDVMIQ